MTSVFIYKVFNLDFYPLDTFKSDTFNGFTTLLDSDKIDCDTVVIFLRIRVHKAVHFESYNSPKVASHLLNLDISNIFHIFHFFMQISKSV